MSLVLADVQPTENPKITEITVLKDFEGMTNGEVIQALFPNETMFEQAKTCTYYGNMRFDTEWWDAPYQKGGE